MLAWLALHGIAMLPLHLPSLSRDGILCCAGAEAIDSLSLFFLWPRIPSNIDELKEDLIILVTCHHMAAHMPKPIYVHCIHSTVSDSACTYLNCSCNSPQYNMMQCPAMQCSAPQIMISDFSRPATRHYFSFPRGTHPRSKG